MILDISMLDYCEIQCSLDVCISRDREFANEEYFEEHTRVFFKEQVELKERLMEKLTRQMIKDAK